MNRAQWKNLPIFFYPEHRINKNWISSTKCNSNTCTGVWIVSCLLQSCSTICDSHLHVLVFGFTYLNLFESIRHSYIDLFLFQSKSHCSNFKIFSCIQHVVEVFKSNKSLEKICENINYEVILSPQYLLLYNFTKKNVKRKIAVLLSFRAIWYSLLKFWLRNN